MSKHLTPPEAAKILGVDQSTVRRWMDNGRLPGKTHPQTGRRTIPADAVVAMANDPQAMHPSSEEA